jgi:crotonobetainyl-CoA:carnitine CoA-transferase CaiB-like acyl-CoA transferase
MSGTPVEYLRPAPMLGEHTDEVLKRQLGLDDERLAELKARGVIEQLGER